MTESFSDFQATSFCMISHARCNIRRLRVELPNTKDDDEAFECLKNFLLKIDFNRFWNCNEIFVLFCQAIGFLFERQWNKKQAKELKSCLRQLKYPTGKGIEWIQQIVEQHFCNKHEQPDQQNLIAAIEILSQIKKGMKKNWTPSKQNSICPFKVDEFFFSPAVESEHDRITKLAFSHDPLPNGVGNFHFHGPTEMKMRSHLKNVLLEPGIPHAFNCFHTIRSRPLITIVYRMMKKANHFDLSTPDLMDEAENHWCMMVNLFKLLLQDVRLDPNSTLVNV